MTIAFMLDTNAISELIRNPNGSLAKRVLKEGNDNIGISAIVASELHFGVEKRNSEKLTTLIDGALSQFAVIDYDDTAARYYGAVRNKLRLSGTPIGPLDTLIAAHALSLSATLITNNLSEFQRVDGLKTEDWITA